MEKLIVSFFPSYDLNKPYWYREGWQIWYQFMVEKWFKSEVWALKRKWQENFTIRWQSWIWFKNLVYIYLRLFLRRKDINVLHIMHVNFSSLLSSIIYKICNSKGVIYCKMDSPLTEEDKDKREKIRRIPWFVRKILFNKIDYFGFEDKILQEFYISEYTKYKNHFLFTTSWFLAEPNIIWDLPKKNRIVLVWRFGVYQKNNEILLEMLKKLDCSFMEDREIYFCGWMTDEFKKKLEYIKKDNERIVQHVHEMGFLNHDELYWLLKTCKIFLHTARFEGDPNIQYDALYTGCFFTSTDIANIKQNYPGDYCLFFEQNDVEKLKIALKKSIDIVNSFTKKDFLNIQDYWLKHFQWKFTLKEILDKF